MLLKTFEGFQIHILYSGIDIKHIRFKFHLKAILFLRFNVTIWVSTKGIIIWNSRNCIFVWDKELLFDTLDRFAKDRKVYDDIL